MNASFSPSPRAVMATIGIVCEFPMQHTEQPECERVVF